MISLLGLLHDPYSMDKSLWFNHHPSLQVSKPPSLKKEPAIWGDAHWSGGMWKDTELLGTAEVFTPGCLHLLRCLEKFGEVRKIGADVTTGNPKLVQGMDVQLSPSKKRWDGGLIWLDVGWLAGDEHELLHGFHPSSDDDGESPGEEGRFFFAGSGYDDLGKGMNQVEREHVQPFLMQRIVKIIHTYPAK